VVFYDGVCGLCARFVRFVLDRDPAGQFRFATLQGALARAVLPARGGRPEDLDTVYVLTADGRLLARSRAVLHVLRGLGGFWRAFALVATAFPAPFADVGYRLVARVRYRVFGRTGECRLPAPEESARFLDQPTHRP
jgi:predicted DCC family thiol-disulfide oxidoreductase YuxK